jgi:hypothetical protein
MTYPKLSAVTTLGLSALAFGLVCLLWLAFGRRGDLADQFAAAWGDRDAAARLAKAHLHGAWAICLALVPLLLEWALTFILLAAAVGLLYAHPAARWAALFYCVCIIPLEFITALLRVFYLTLPGQPVRIVPIVMNCLITLGAIGLWGGLFLPEVETAFAGPGAEPPPEQGEPPAQATPDEKTS